MCQCDISRDSILTSQSIDSTDDPRHDHPTSFSILPLHFMEYSVSLLPCHGSSSLTKLDFGEASYSRNLSNAPKTPRTSSHLTHRHHELSDLHHFQLPLEILHFPVPKHSLSPALQYYNCQLRP